MKRNTSVIELPLSVRALNCLRSADIQTVGELINFYYEHGIKGLLKLRNFGKRTAYEIEEVIEGINLDELEDDPQEEPTPDTQSDELVTLMQMAGKDIKGLLQVVGDMLLRYHGDLGSSAFLGAVTFNFMDILFGCKFHEGTDEERKAAAAAWFAKVLEGTQPSSFNVDKDNNNN